MTSTRSSTARPPRPRPLVGRERELEALRAAFGPGVVVVTGTPGVGKSSLVAAAVAGRQDVLWVDLAGARGAADLWAALGRALGSTLVHLDDAVPRVTRLLQARGVALVVLDPGELLSAGAWGQLQALVEANPGTGWVVCSVVAPDLPDASGLALSHLAVGPLPQGAAVELLLRLARAQALDAPPDPLDPAWAALAQRLDGLPLALELAAARLPLLSPASLLARVDDARTLSGGRHASAEGALRYAWALLSAQERADLAALSPLRAGFTLDAAEAALGSDALDRLDALRARSALLVHRGRFQHIEGLRRIAREEDPAAAAAASERLVAWWAVRADALRVQTRGPRGEEASRLLAIEQPNLRAAWEQARQHAPRAAASIGAALLTSMFSAGPAWGLSGLQGLEAIAREVGGALGAEVLNRMAALLLLLYRVDEARPLLVEALAMATASRDASELAHTLCNLGLMHMTVGENDLARGALARAASVASQAPDEALAALAFLRLGAVEMRVGDTEAAAEALEEARQAVARGAFPRLAGTVHLNLAIVRGDQGRLAEAEELIHRAIEETGVHDEGGHAFALFNAALLALAQGEHERAAALAEPAVAALDALGSEVFRGYARIPLALARWGAGDRAAARELLAEAARRMAPLDPTTTAIARAWRAALDAASGQAEALPLALAEAREAGVEADLVEALAGFAPHHESGPPPAKMGLYARIARRLARPEPPAARISRDGRWLERGGQRVDLSRRGALHRILAGLVAARLDRPGEGLSVEQVFDLGWPGERALPEAAASRVYTAVRVLRGQGLGELLQRRAEGYLIDPEARIAVEG